MELNEALQKRRSIRNFIDKPVDKKIIESLINAAALAPSACNVQGWKFIAVDNEKIKQKIFETGGSIAIKNSPTGILALYDNQTENYEYQDDIQSASAAIQNLLLKATELGLGACWICHLPRKKTLRKIFNIPANYSPIAYILLGYPRFKPIEMPRKYTLNGILSYNKFPSAWKIKKINPFKLKFKRLLARLYYLTPNIIKKIFLNKLIDSKFVKKFSN